MAMLNNQRVYIIIDIDSLQHVIAIAISNGDTQVLLIAAPVFAVHRSFSAKQDKVGPARCLSCVEAFFSRGNAKQECIQCINCSRYIESTIAML